MKTNRPETRPPRGVMLRNTPKQGRPAGFSRPDYRQGRSTVARRARGVAGAVIYPS